MKKIIALYIGFSTLIYSNSVAQEMSEKEQKAVLKELTGKLKTMDMSEAKAMFNDYPSLKTQVESLNSKVSGLESEVSSKNSEISTLKTNLKNAEDSIAKLNTQEMATTDVESSTETTSNTTSTARTNNSGQKTIPGLVYKIQIGAFRDKDLTKYFENNPNFGGEVDDDGTKKYTIGVFTEYWEADTFKKYMRSMGVKDAWIVPYYNGKRVSMKDAREGVLK